MLWSNITVEAVIKIKITDKEIITAIGITVCSSVRLKKKKTKVKRVKKKKIQEIIQKEAMETEAITNKRGVEDTKEKTNNTMSKSLNNI